MEIITGKTAGFCYGVERAVNGAKDELNRKKDNNIYCLGEIVHNKQVISELEKQGLKFIEKIDKIKNTDVIIRAHGVKKEIYEIANKNKINIKDYTCQNVLKIHEIAERYVANGYYVFLCGSQKHPENIGTISYCGKNSYIIEDETQVNEAIKLFKKSSFKKLLLISQTTYSVKKFNIIKENILKEISYNIDFVVKNTICRATEMRQKETEEIAKKVDGMIIIGGKNSSNTKKIYELAKQYCNKVLHIENKDEIQENWINNLKIIGIMAGASTPRDNVKEVINRLNKIEHILKV